MGSKVEALCRTMVGSALLHSRELFMRTALRCLLAAGLLGMALSASAQIAVTPIETPENGFVSLPRSVWFMATARQLPPKAAFCLETPPPNSWKPAEQWCKKLGTAQQYLSWRYPQAAIQFRRMEHACRPDSVSAGNGGGCESRLNLYYYTNSGGYGTVPDETW
jgi:hypothetical protein